MRRLTLLLALALSLATACDDEESRPLGSECSTTDQCAAPLTCDWGRCREACETVSDCAGLPCVPDEAGAAGVCLDGDDFAQACSLGCTEPTICDPEADRCVAPCDATWNPCARTETCTAEGLCRSPCGDGVVDAAAGESCDDGGESAECDADCTPAECGDGTLNVTAGEVCDDGDTNPGDGCSSNCRSDETCGNGIVDAVGSETCDDGGDTAECDADCTRPVCGDGWVNPAAGEECDDGNTSDEGEGGCSSRCLEIRCGNGRLDPGEAIDLGIDDPTHCFVCPFDLGTPPDCDRCVYFVDAESPTDHPDGRSWGSAFHSVQEGVDAAAATRPAGVEACDVWVAAGSYRGEVEDGHVVALRPRVHVRGGFQSGALDLTGRHDAAATTILDGDGAVRHVVVLEADAEGVTGAALLEGFTLRRGFAPRGTSGGGALVSGDGASLQLRRVRFEANEALDAGGGLSLAGGASAWLENVVFLDNSADSGAAIALDGASSVHVVNTTFVGNAAATGPAAVTLLDDGSAATVVNAILDDLGDPDATEVSPAVQVRRSLFAQGDAGDPADENLVGDPLYVDLEGGDLTPGAGSPALDRADGCLAPVTDLLGRPRANDASAADLGRGPRADLGALEATGGAPEPADAFFDACCDTPIEHDGRWYRRCAAEGALLPWAQARRACESRGARLASIGDADENAAVVSALAADPLEPAWLGGREVPVGDGWSWQWSDGETWSYPDGSPSWGWADGCYPPAEDGDLCLALDGETSLGCPADCATPAAYVCEEQGDL